MKTVLVATLMIAAVIFSPAAVQAQDIKCRTEVFIVDGSAYQHNTEKDGRTPIERLRDALSGIQGLTFSPMLFPEEQAKLPLSLVEQDIIGFAQTIGEGKTLVIVHNSAFSGDAIASKQEKISLFLNQLSKNAVVIVYSRSGTSDPKFREYVVSQLENSAQWTNRLATVGNNKNVPRWGDEDSEARDAIVSLVSRYKNTCNLGNVLSFPVQ